MMPDTKNAEKFFKIGCLVTADTCVRTLVLQVACSNGRGCQFVMHDQQQGVHVIVSRYDGVLRLM